MSVSEIPKEDYRMEYNPETGYVTFDFENPVEAEKVIEEYRSNRDILEQFISATPLGDPSPVMNPEEPSEILVLDNKTDRFKQVADEVLEE